MAEETLIDSLVVRLTLDPKLFEQGRKQVDVDMRRVRTEADSTAKSVEASGKRAANFFGSLRSEVVGLFLAFAGARGITGFVGGLIQSDAAVGRLARNLGVATRELSAWQGLAKRTGGSAGDADSAFRTLAGEFQSYQLTGQAAHAADFQGLGLMPQDLARPTEALLKMAAAGERMTRPEFVARLQRIGIPESVINTLVNGRRATEALLREQYRLGTATDESSEAAQRMEARLSELQTAIQGKARPWIVWLLENMLTLSSNTDLAASAMPILAAAVGAVAAPFIVAYGPIMAIGAAIAYVLYEVGAFQRAIPQFQATISTLGTRLGFLKAEYDAIRRHDVEGFKALLQEDLRYTFGAAGRTKLEGVDAGGPIAGIRGWGGTSRAGSALSGGYLDRVFNALVRQESGGNGNAISSAGALGSTQMLPATAQAMARKLGVAWRPDLIRGRSPEAIAYQRQLGRAYFDEGMQKYGGDVSKALMYYHGGPDERQWGPKTRAYQASILGMAGRAGNTSATTVNIGTINTKATDARGLAAELPGAIAQRGLAVNADSGLTM